MNQFKISALRVSREIQEGKKTVEETVDGCLKKIRENSKLNSFITIASEKELQDRAEQVSQELGNHMEFKPLAGTVVAVKDNLCTQGILTTCGSKMLESFVPDYSATVVRQMEDAGMILIGKTNMDEFAMGNTSENSYFGPVGHPWLEGCIPGGSSGGSAAAVAAGQCHLALGTDTGGSVRQPAALCDVVGIKPTYGSISRYGLIAYASSMDQVGILGNYVEDCAVLLEILREKDRKDGTSVYRPKESFQEKMKLPVQGMRIGVISSWKEDPSVKEAADILEKSGAKILEVSLEHQKLLIPVYYTLASAEASSNLSRFDGMKYGYRAKAEGLQKMYEDSRKEGLGKEVQRRILLGNYVLSAKNYEDSYVQAQKGRRLIKEAYDQIWKRCDVLLTPVTADSMICQSAKKMEPWMSYQQDLYTVGANLTGCPAMSLPMGRTLQGFPKSVQLMADQWMESVMLQAAYTLEQYLQTQGGWEHAGRL